MAARSVELALAIVEDLAALGTEWGFTPQRLAVPYRDIKDIHNLKVVVFDGTKAKERKTRKSFERTFKPTVAVLKKLESAQEDEQLAEADELAKLVEAIEERFEDATISGLAFESFDEEQDADPYNIELMKAQGAFARAITLTFTTTN